MSLSTSLLQSEPGKFGLWPSVWKLLGLRLRIWYNTFRRSKTRNKIGTSILVLFLLGVIVGLFFLSTLLLGFLNSPGLAQYINPAQFLTALPTMVLTAAFFLTILTNFGILLQALYLSHDMDFLVASPLPMRAVFLAKLLEAILPNFALFCAFTLPVLFGLGTSNGYTILYYLMLVVVLVLLALAAGGLASILVMAVVRVIPARRVAEALGVMGALISVLCGQSGNLINSMGIRQANFSGALGLFSRLNTPWSPMAWAGNGLISIGKGEWLPGIGLTLLTLFLACAIFIGTLLLAEQLYYTGWTSMQGNARKKRPARPPAPFRPVSAAVASPVVSTPVASSPAASAMKTMMPASASTISRPARQPRSLPRIAAPVRGLMIKDFLLLRRDPRNLSQLITPVIIGFVFIFTTRNSASGLSGLTGKVNGLNIELYGLLGLSIFVSWMLLTNLAPLAFSREGKNYWLLKSAPIRPLHLVSAKYLVSFLPPMAFGMVYLTLGFVIHRFTWSLFPFSLIVIVLSIAGATGISLAFGIAGANLEWDSPQRQRLHGATGWIMMIAVLAFFGVDLAMFLVPSILWLVITGSAPLLSYLIGLVLGGIASLIAAILPPMLVLPRMSRIGEK